MSRKASDLTRWFGLLGAVALLAIVAAPVHANKTVASADQPANTGSDGAARVQRLQDRQEAADAWNAEHPDASGAPTLRVNGLAIMRFRTPAGGYTAVQRYGIVQARLVKASAGLDYASLGNVTTAMVGGAPVIYLCGSQLVTVTAADARANGGSASGLARTWAANLRRGLASTAFSSVAGLEHQVWSPLQKRW